MNSLHPTAPGLPASPLRIRFYHGNSIRFHLEALFASVRDRRDPVTRESRMPIVMWHLVAGVLTLRGKLEPGAVVSLSVQSPIRVGDTLIHITHCPDWPVMHACFAASDQGMRPLLVSSRAGAAQAESLAGEVGMGRKIEVLDITQLLVANMLEWTGFDGSRSRHSFEDLITRYNAIVEACETDPSLKTEAA